MNLVRIREYLEDDANFKGRQAFSNNQGHMAPPLEDKWLISHWLQGYDDAAAERAKSTHKQEKI